MLISKEPSSEKKIQIRTRLKESTLSEIEDYCKWAGINSKDYFIEQACQYIFLNSPRWKLFKEQQMQTD